jgi:hypothetical protein
MNENSVVVLACRWERKADDAYDRDSRTSTRIGHRISAATRPGEDAGKSLWPCVPERPRLTEPVRTLTEALQGRWTALRKVPQLVWIG